MVADCPASSFDGVTVCWVLGWLSDWMKGGFSRIRQAMGSLREFCWFSRSRLWEGGVQCFTMRGYWPIRPEIGHFRFPPSPSVYGRTHFITLGPSHLVLPTSYSGEDYHATWYVAHMWVYSVYCVYYTQLLTWLWSQQLCKDPRQYAAYHRV